MDYDRKYYKTWAWWSPAVLHWIVNPALVINELVLGQTMPVRILIQRDGDEPFFRRVFIPCPHCGTLHRATKWSFHSKTMFKNWFGYYCDQCGGIIPVRRNLTSWLLLGVTFPLWGWFRKGLMQRWLERQPARYSHSGHEPLDAPVRKGYWPATGLVWGGLMYGLTTFVIPLIGNENVTLASVFIGIPIWLIGGLGFGYTMKVWMNRPGKGVPKNKKN